VSKSRLNWDRLTRENKGLGGRGNDLYRPTRANQRKRTTSDRASSERMLRETFDLTFTASGEIVRDVESLARGAMGAERWTAYLEPADDRDLLATLLSDAVLLERQYSPREGIEARPWLFQRLRWKALDWRRVHDRHRVTADLRGEELAWDDELGDASSADRRAGLGSGSHGAPGEVAGDRGDPRSDALRGLLESGDRTLLREIEALGLGPPPGARGRTARADRALRRLERARLRRLEALAERDREVVAA
jgi:hypothetical protein